MNLMKKLIKKIDFKKLRDKEKTLTLKYDKNVNFNKYKIDKKD